MLPIYFLGNYNRYKEHNNKHCLVEQILSYKTLFCIIVTINSCAFLPAMNKSLHATLIKIFTGGGDTLLLSPLLEGTNHCLTVLVSPVWSQ